MNSSFSRRRLRWVMVTLAAAAFAAPVAQARHAPGEDPAITNPQHSLPVAPAKGSQAPALWNASPLEIDRLGPKHVALQHPVSPPTSVVKIVFPSGFDWADAGIGAGAASLTLALVAGLTMLVVRPSRRTIATERSELAGT